MEDALSKIRPHTTSNLAHQKAPAVLLQALESTLQDRETDKTSTAYFATLLTTLDGTLQKKDISLGEGDVLPAELYLLALVTPFVPSPVLRSNLNTLLSLTAPLFPSLLAHAPSLRSQLSIYNVIFRSLERSQLDIQGVRQSFASVLQLCMDPRPKVRKKAADVVKDVLSNPPSPMARHPYADRVAEWVRNALREASSGALSKSKVTGKTPETSAAESAIHILAFLRPVLLKLPASTLPSITTLLLTLPRLGNPYLSQSAYSILSELFSAPTTDEPNNVVDQIPDVLKAVLASIPSKSDVALCPSWLQVLGHAMLAYSGADSQASATELPLVWKTVWSFLESDKPQIRKAAAESLTMMSECITTDMVAIAIEGRGTTKIQSTLLEEIISQTMKALGSLAFSRAIPELLVIISALITRLRFRQGSRQSPTAAELLLIPLIQKVGELRTQKAFEHKEAADATLATAMRHIGPAVLLTVLPLNLEPADRQAGQEPRAFLLPMLPQPHVSPLGHFVSYFVPLSERMFNLQQEAEMEDRQAEAKVWSVLVSQIWSGLAGYCHATVDLKESFTSAFCQLLSQLLYGQPELRPAILKALKVIVESNVSLASKADSEMDGASEEVTSISPAEAAQNVVFLKSQAESWFAVLFNIFSSADRDGRGIVGDVISAWAGIADEQEIAKAYNKVLELFKQNLANAQSAPASQGGGSITAMTQDLLILLLPHLSEVDATSLFQTCLSKDILSNKDNGVQKRGYKTLAKLLSSGKVPVEVQSTLSRLDELAEGLLAAAKKDRFNLLSLLVREIPPEAMHIIPSLISEAVLGTKEASEKARTAAFELIVVMGKKMNEGGVVRRNMMDGMDEDGESEGEAQASVNEYMTMIAGGLAGATPHMISATVTAISRLVFEFRDTINDGMQIEIFTTLLAFLSSTNREIVKSTLGYIKLAIHSLSSDLLRPFLKDLVPALLAWSHDHKNHFKAKVRHIFERMLRRFGWNDVYRYAGEDQASKVLVNIKKRKERAKRKKARDEEDEDEEIPKGKAATGDAFEDVLYGSESEIDDSDDDERTSRPNAAAKRKADHGVRLRVDDDEPMDLLQGAAARLTSANANRRRKPGQDAARFNTDKESGKMLIEEEDSDSDIEVSARKAAGDIAGNAYRESLTSVDGFVRGAGGRVKFNKDTKKRRREQEAEEDVEMVDVDAGKGKKSKKRSEVKFGHEFKAKRAGGDVKKGGVDPYAYLPLNQAAKKKSHGKERLGIATRK
ncbi:hypothetical protein SERLA73DRAFT_122251 [Serpula lacrymans var. lacrymans S7.3]|uniref:Uncharacterized protein n=2 Tax=Serpula lacrymans var. lacrymans TaxID=341189 RepID=F8PVQ8_SERL3|nr:uncharacterized protein SERLADRAFT_448686 [Serpula lacrymans var. lacrymans S7.9]EGO00192.1 hypothetical protein SERLA73DRAFT_122251 [Serpula lacrymans var. lacrymans S7.3]EGO25750.1 hypothetical protein SERLADRAFT_448686 [Serpula lacrymans var. lacrymans S7.9]